MVERLKLKILQNMKIDIDIEGLTDADIESVRAYAQARRGRNKDRAQVKECGTWRASELSGFTLCDKYRVEPEPTVEDYLAGHKSSGIKVGDTVKVTRIYERFEKGYPVKPMESDTEWVGRTATIIADFEKDGFFFRTDRGTTWFLPHFCLEKVELTIRPWTASEAIGKVVKKRSSPSLETVRAGFKKSCLLSYSFGHITYPTLLADWLQEDGSPCGVEGGDV